MAFINRSILENTLNLLLNKQGPLTATCRAVLLLQSGPEEQLFLQFLSVLPPSFPTTYRQKILEQLERIQIVDPGTAVFDIPFSQLLTEAKARQFSYSPLKSPNFFEWEERLKDPEGNLTEWLLLGPEEQNCWLIPLSLGPIPLCWLLSHAAPQEIEQPLEILRQHLLFWSCQELSDRIKEQEIVGDQPGDRIKAQFTEQLAALFLATKQPENKSLESLGITGYQFRKIQLIQANKAAEYYLPVPPENDPKLLAEEALSLALLEQQVQVVYNKLEDHFQKVAGKEGLPSGSLHKLSVNIEEYLLSVSELSHLTRQLSPLSEEIRSFLGKKEKQMPLVSAENEFFKNSTGWHIRFGGNIVHCGSNEMGLNSIHQLLSNPGKVYYPNELEAIKKKRKNLYLIQVSESFAVELEPDFRFNSPEDESELLRTLNRLRKSVAEEDSDFETQILILSEMLYLSDSLRKIKSKADYIALYNYFKKLLEDKIREFEDQEGDSLFVSRVLSDAGIVKRAYDPAIQSRRLRQSVHKNIKNAIDSMSNNELKSYFSNTLVYGARSSFSPLPEALDWKLEPYS